MPPEDDDYMLTPTEPLGSQVAAGQVNGTYLGTFSDEDAALVAVRQRMARDQFWPNVWWQDDHGGLTLLTLPDPATVAP